MAVPFARGGAAAGEAVLAITTPANLELLAGALGVNAVQVEQMDSAVFYGLRPPQRVTVLEKFAQRRGGGGRVRILGEPPWTGWTDTEVRDWQQLEAGVNLLLEGTGMWVICPYDCRQLPASILRSALRTHPALIEGTTTRRSPGYTDPVSYAASNDGPLLPPPGGATLLPATIRLGEIRHFAASQAAAADLDPDAAIRLAVAVEETARYVKNAARSPVTIQIWQQSGTIVCDLQADGPATAGTFDGYLMPDPGQPRPDDGLWYARQFTTRLDLRATAHRIQARLQLSGPCHLHST